MPAMHAPPPLSKLQDALRNRPLKEAFQALNHAYAEADAIAALNAIAANVGMPQGPPPPQAVVGAEMGVGFATMGVPSEAQRPGGDACLNTGRGEQVDEIVMDVGLANTGDTDENDALGPPNTGDTSASTGASPTEGQTFRKHISPIWEITLLQNNMNTCICMYPNSRKTYAAIYQTKLISEHKHAP